MGGKSGKHGQAFLWQSGKTTDLTPAASATTDVIAKNDLGEVVINADRAQRALVWHDGITTPLPPLRPGLHTWAAAHGQVVGSAETKTGNWPAALWAKTGLTRCP